MVDSGGNAGMPDIDELMKQMMGDGDMMKGLENLGPEMDEVMKLMANMSPEDLAKQMQDAMVSLFLSNSRVQNIVCILCLNSCIDRLLISSYIKSV